MGINLVPVLEVATNIVPYLKLPHLQTDNAVFRLHYMVSVTILYASSLVVTHGQYFGNPISCLVKGKTISEGVMNTYCWIHSTFTLPKNVSMDIGSQIAHPGVGTYEETDEQVYAQYYQWVSYTLFFQGCCFLGPYYLWKTFENERLSQVVPSSLMLNDHTSAGVCFKPPSMLKQKEREVAVAKMKDHFITKSNRVENRHYMEKFALCEVLNFVNVMLQIALMDYFLGGMFSTYGSDILRISQLDPSDRNDSMDRVFPKVGKCTFHKYGASGTIMRSDSICVLPLNIMNEKIYVLLWFWFIFLAIISGLQLTWRLAIYTSSSVRQQYLRSKTYWQADINDLKAIDERISYGDFFTLTNIAENIDDRIFTTLLSEMGKHFQKKNDQDYINNFLTTSV